jgi:hypothetical protein
MQQGIGKSVHICITKRSKKQPLLFKNLPLPETIITSAVYEKTILRSLSQGKSKHT